MRELANETTDKRLVITRKDINNGEPDVNIIVLPGQSYLLTGTYNYSAYSDNLTEKDKEDMRALRAAGHHQFVPDPDTGLVDPPPAAPVEIDGNIPVVSAAPAAAEEASSEQALLEEHRASDDGMAQPPTQPPVDNANVAEGAEKFDEPPATSGGGDPAAQAEGASATATS